MGSPVMKLLSLVGDSLKIFLFAGEKQYERFEIRVTKIINEKKYQKEIRKPNKAFPPSKIIKITRVIVVQIGVVPPLL
jgi:hypothetical protein